MDVASVRGAIGALVSASSTPADINAANAFLMHFSATSDVWPVCIDLLQRDGDVIIARYAAHLLCAAPERLAPTTAAASLVDALDGIFTRRLDIVIGAKTAVCIVRLQLHQLAIVVSHLVQRCDSIASRYSLMMVVTAVIDYIHSSSEITFERRRAAIAAINGAARAISTIIESSITSNDDILIETALQCLLQCQSADLSILSSIASLEEGRLLAPILRHMPTRVLAIDVIIAALSSPSSSTSSSFELIQHASEFKTLMEGTSSPEIAHGLARLAITIPPDHIVTCRSGPHKEAARTVSPSLWIEWIMAITAHSISLSHLTLDWWLDVMTIPVTDRDPSISTPIFTRLVHLLINHQRYSQLPDIEHDEQCTEFRSAAADLWTSLYFALGVNMVSDELLKQLALAATWQQAEVVLDVINTLASAIAEEHDANTAPVISPVINTCMRIIVDPTNSAIPQLVCTATNLIGSFGFIISGDERESAIKALAHAIMIATSSEVITAIGKALRRLATLRRLPPCNIAADDLIISCINRLLVPAMYAKDVKSIAASFTIVLVASTADPDNRQLSRIIDLLLHQIVSANALYMLAGIVAHCSSSMSAAISSSLVTILSTSSPPHHDLDAFGTVSSAMINAIPADLPPTPWVVSLLDMLLRPACASPTCMYALYTASAHPSLHQLLTPFVTQLLNQCASTMLAPDILINFIAMCSLLLTTTRIDDRFLPFAMTLLTESHANDRDLTFSVLAVIDTTLQSHPQLLTPLLDTLTRRLLCLISLWAPHNHIERLANPLHHLLVQHPRPVQAIIVDLAQSGQLRRPFNSHELQLLIGAFTALAHTDRRKRFTALLHDLCGICRAQTQDVSTECLLAYQLA